MNFLAWKTGVLAAMLMVIAGLATPTEAFARVPRGHAHKHHHAHADKAHGARKRVRHVALRHHVHTVVWHQPTMGEQLGLTEGRAPLGLRSAVALVVDQDSNEVLVDKNAHAVLPIASLTKLMTAVLIVEAAQPMDEVLTITSDDIDTERGSRSRLYVGAQLPRGEMLHLALMSSENRAAHALGRNYPGGLAAFVAAMNRKAAQLGMTETSYVDPTGLSNQNRSSGRDLSLLVKYAYRYTAIRDLSTRPDSEVAVGDRVMRFRNTNSLVRNPEWAIGLQKTGFINEAGRCLVMQASMAGRRLIMVFLDAAGRHTRQADAERVRHWLLDGGGEAPRPTASLEGRTS